MIAELIVLGNIFTSDDEALYVEGFAVCKGKIICVGSRAEVLALAGANTKVLEYSDGMIIPGITEGHAHVTTAVEVLAGPYCGYETVEETVQAIADFAKQHPGEDVIYGGGFDPAIFGETGPSADLIDAVVPNRPVLISDSGHHSIWVNTKAMEIAGITPDTKAPKNGIINHYGNGMPSGFFQEEAIGCMNPAMPVFDEKKYVEAILYYQKLGLSYGITNVFEPMLSHSHDEKCRLDAYRKLDNRQELKMTCRVGLTLWTSQDEEEFFRYLAEEHAAQMKSEKFQVNTVKIFLDGVVDGHTALLAAPYLREPLDCGPVMYEQEKLNARVKRALEEGYNVHIHAIGDGAINEALAAFEYAQTTVGPRDYRNAITHLQVTQPDHPEKMAKLNVVAVTNPYWHHINTVYEPLELPYLGKERAEHQYFMNSFLQNGVHISTASDFPITIVPDTMLCLHMMVNRKAPKDVGDAYWPEERIPVEDALKIMTAGGAYQNMLEERKGSISKGKDADFVVLDREVTRISPEDIYKTKVLETWVDGVCVYQRN